MSVLQYEVSYPQPEVRDLLLAEIGAREVRHLADERKHALLGHEAALFAQRRRGVLLVVREPRPTELDALELVRIVERLDTRFAPSAALAKFCGFAEARDLQRGAVEATARSRPRRCRPPA